MKNILAHNWYEWQEAPSADFAVIGDPISHSLSPLIHNEVLNHLKLLKTYSALRVPSSKFFEALTHLRDKGYFGLNVTSPLKELAYQWAVNKHNNIRAYNTLNLKTKEGINTDQIGFYKTLINKKWEDPCSVLFLGGGATTKSLSLFLLEKKFDVHVFSSHPDKFTQWTNKYSVPITVHSEIKNISVQLIINTLPPLQLKKTLFQLSHFFSLRLYDLNYSNPDSLSQYLQKRFEYMNGLHMLVEQGALSMEWWLKRPIPKHIMLKALKLI